MRRIFRACALVLLAVFLAMSAFSETALCGDWAYENDPGVTVLTLNEDGTAAYGGQALTWADEGTDFLLTDENGAFFRLVYEAAEDGLTVWLPARFQRISEIGGEGEITGTWQAEGSSLSSFVFTEDGRFLEDGVFTGSFLQDAENGTVTLQYLNGMFADTVILYMFEGEAMIVSYPWKLIRK